MAGARSQDMLSPDFNELVDINTELAENLMLADRSSTVSPDDWEIDLEVMFNTLLFKFRDKKNEMKGQEETLIDLKKMLEEDYQKKIKEYADKKKELETQYTRKINDFELEKSKMEKVYKIQNGKIKLDVGGHMFTTSIDTVSRDPDSMIAVMFSGRHNLIQSEDGSYFIDRDGTHFRYILNYLRGGITLPSEIPEDVNVLRELNREADFYQLRGLQELIKEAIGTPNDKLDYAQEEITEMMSSLVPCDFMTTSSSFMSRNSDDNYGDMMEPSISLSNDSLSSRVNFITQNMTKSDLNFTNKTLNGISFAHTTFFHNVSFRSANLVGASFYGCEFGVGVSIDFSYADLTDCDFRQCKGKRNGSQMNNSHSRGGGLVSGSSSDVFLKLVTEKNIEFRRAKLKGAMFDPQIYKHLISECSLTS